MSELREFAFDQSALVSRLSTALKRRPQQVICIVGSPLSAPIESAGPGVPGVSGILDMIRAEFADSKGDLEELQVSLRQSDGRQYQAAFQFVQGRRGQSVANEIIKRAVLRAPSQIQTLITYSAILNAGSSNPIEIIGT